MRRHSPFISCTGTTNYSLERLKLHDGKRELHLQMGNDLDFNIGLHGQLLDSDARAALGQQSFISSLLPFLQAYLFSNPSKK